MSGGIYLMQSDGELVKMAEQHYASEDLLQGFLAKHPDLLAGDQIDTSQPRRWLLVSREVSVASEEAGAGRWSVDHLFLDQDAVPTIVEVKRSNDTRIRREVVGQMLDYAANAVVYWPIESLRSRFEGSREEPEQDLVNFLEAPDANPEDFWLKVKTNLQAGKVRLIFVADEIPTELRRVVEFLNQQMDPAEVLAVEVKQYVSQDSNLKTLVPRIVGQTAEAEQKKKGLGRGYRQWDEASFFEVLESNRGAEEAAAAAKILEWSRDKLPRFEWNASGRNGVFYPCLDYRGISYWPIGIRTDGTVEAVFQYVRQRPPFQDETKLVQLRNRLNEIPGVDLPADRMTGRPTFPLSALRDEAALNQFLKVIAWFIREVQES